MNIPDVSKYLSPEEQKELLLRDDIKGLLEVLHTWLWIAAAFSLVYLWPNAFTITISLFILGGKQLGCSIIMHDTSHKSLFRTSVLNEFFGKWFGAYPVLNDMLRYRPYHVKHHVNTGLADDPDINLTTGYPSGKASIIRKFLRDLTGITAVKTTIALLMMHL